MPISQEVDPPSMLSDHALCHARTASRRPTPIGGCTSSEAAFPCPCLLPLFCFYSSEPRSPATLWWCPSSPVLAHFRALCVLSGPMQEVPKRYYYVIQEKITLQTLPHPTQPPYLTPHRRKGLRSTQVKNSVGLKWRSKNQENGDFQKNGDSRKKWRLIFKA